MRKRKWQTLIYLIFIFVFLNIHFHVQQIYFSPEDVFFACERGLRSGPSKEIILEFEGDDGAKVLVGRQEEGLFVVPVEKTHLFFWRMQSGGIDGFFKCDKPLNGYQTYGGNYLGLCLDDEITEFSILVGSHEDREWRELIYPVEEELIFEEAGIDWMNEYIEYTEGRNKAGEVIFWDGNEKLIKAIREGNYTYGQMKVTSHYVTAPGKDDVN